MYSSAISFAAMGIKLPTPSIRAVIAVVMSLAGLVVAAIGLNNIGSYENFLLVIAYWVGPWLGVVFADRLLRRFRTGEAIYTDAHYKNWAGPICHVRRSGGLDLAVLGAEAVHRAGRQRAAGRSAT